MADFVLQIILLTNSEQNNKHPSLKQFLYNVYIISFS